MVCLMLHNKVHHTPLIAHCATHGCGRLSKRVAGEWKGNVSAIPYVHSTRSGDLAGLWSTMLQIMHFMRTNMMRIMMHNTAYIAHCTVRAYGGLSMRAAGGWKGKDSAVRTVCSAPSGDHPKAWNIFPC